MLHAAEAKGKSLQVITSGGVHYDVHPNRSLHNGKKVRTTDSGMIPYSSIEGHTFTEQPTHSDSTRTDRSSQYSDQTLLGGFVGQAFFKTDRSRQDSLRNDMTKAIEDPEYRQDRKQQRTDSATNTKVATLPTVSLTEDQKVRVKQMIETGSDMKQIRSVFGRVDSADLRGICDELQISTLDRIIRGLS